MTRNRKKRSIALYTIILCSLFAIQIPVSIYAQEDHLTEAREIEPNKPLDGTISRAGESDWYRFNATAGSSYVIEVYNESVSMSAFFTLYTAKEKIVAWSATKITHNFTESGTYLIEVKHSDPAYGVGTYSILLRLAKPPSIVVNVYDELTFEPIGNATVKVYTPLTYTLLGENRTSAEGQTIIQLSTRGYYLVTVSADGYNDLFGVTSLLDEGPNIRWGSLTLTTYSGFVFSSALVNEVVVPGRANTVSVSIHNANTTYPITLNSVTIRLPWYGFYDGFLRGEIIDTEDMPVTILPNTSVVFSIAFTVPPDVTAYAGSLAAASYADLNAEAPAWKTTYKIIEGVGLQENHTLITTPIYPALQQSQGFRVPLEGVSLIPTTDPPLMEKITEVSMDVQDISSRLKTVTDDIDEIIFRVGEINAELFTTSSTLKRVVSRLEDTNRNLDKVSSKLTLSDSKLADISTELAATNRKLDDVNEAVSTLASQQRDTNSKLDSIDRQMTATREDANRLIIKFSEDLRTLLIVIIGITVVIAAVNTLYLARNLTKP